MSIICPQYGGKFIDCTFGQGGYSKKILEFENTKVIALDRDIESETKANLLKNKFEDRFLFKNIKFSQLNNLKLKNENCELIVGIGRMSFLNKLAAILAFNFKAHDGTKTSPTEQLKIISEYVEIISKKTVFYMTDIYLLKFRDKI